MPKFNLILIIISILFTNIYASTIDEKVLLYEKQRLSKDKNIQIEKIEIYNKQDIKKFGWMAYVLNIKLNINNKKLAIKDVLFTNGSYISNNLINLESNENLIELIRLPIDTVYYNKRHLIAGKYKSKKKILIFSDPLCKKCKIIVPKLINYVNKYKNTFALYYYNFPDIKQNPASDIVSKAILYLIKKRKINSIIKIHQTNFNKYFSNQETNKETILKGINNILNTNIKLSDLETSDTNNELLFDIQMGENLLIYNELTIFINGIKEKDIINSLKI